MRKKILIITDNLPDQINGVVTTFKNIEKCANADGFDIVYLDPGQFYHIDCPGYSDVKLSIPFKIGKKIESISPDYIHIATEGPIGFFARCYLDRKNIKYNTSYHTKFPEFLKKLYGIPECVSYAYFRWFHKHSGKVLTTTNTMVKELEEHGFRSDIIPWTRGVDREIFNKNLRTEYEGKVLLSVGRVSKEKGIENFCSLDCSPWVKKIVVGDGPCREELQSKYPDVKFVGVKTGKELAEYYANADVFVFTSKVDTFGIVIIEALSVGTPVAAYKVPGPIDIIEPGVNGYMEEILNDPLNDCINRCLSLDRDEVEKSSIKWSWQECWNVFRENLIQLK
jgi:glycosyltransferase involved in cell wall biosynthesis